MDKEEEGSSRPLQEEVERRRSIADQQPATWLTRNRILLVRPDPGLHQKFINSWVSNVKKFKFSKGKLVLSSVVDPDPDPHGSGTFAWIQIWIRN